MAKRYSAKKFRTRFPKKKGKKKYGRSKKNSYYATSRSAVPQRKNLATKLLSDAPKIGFKPIKYSDHTYTETATTSQAASAVAPDMRDDLTANEYGGNATYWPEGIGEGHTTSSRLTDRIRIHRMVGRIQFTIPAVDDQVGTGTALAGGSETIRVLVVMDRQNNGAMMTDTSNILDEKTAADFTQATYNEDFRRRYKVFYDKTIQLTSQVVAVADLKYYAPEVNKNITFTIDPKETVQYKEASTTGGVTDVRTNAFYLVWGHTNKQVTQFGNTCNRSVKIVARLRTYYTDV